MTGGVSPDSGERAVRSSFLARGGLLLATVLATLAFAGSASATGSVTAATCIEANEQAGPLRHAGKLREARASLRLCSTESCPIAVRKDCIAGAAQADADVPTIAFSVQGPDGNDLTTVSITLDGQPLIDRLDGKAVDVDPGEHVFRFAAPGVPPVEKRIVVIQGQKNREERVQLGAPKLAVAVPATQKLEPSRQRSTGIIVGGAGLALLAGGTIAGIVAAFEWSATKSDCGGSVSSCTNANGASSAHSATITSSTVADIALGLGGVAFVTGVVMVVLAPPPGRATSASSATLRVAPQLGPGANGLVLQGSF